MKSIILAAGRGSRLSPLTDTTPKTLLPLSENNVILDYILDNLPTEITEVIIVANYLVDQIDNYIQKKGSSLDLTLISQKTLNGTWGALSAAENIIKQNEKFLVIHGDDIHKKEHIVEIIKYDRAYSLQKSPKKAFPIEIVNGKTVLNIAPNPPHSDFITTGMYVLDSDFFKLTPLKINEREYSLPHTILNGYPEYMTTAYVEDNWIQINSHEDLANAQMQLK